MSLTAKRLFGIALSSVFILSGCAFATAQLDLAYVPEPAKKSPLSTFKPMTIGLQVEDQREVDKRDRVGDKKNNLGMVTAKVKSNKEVTVVLHDALKNELENNGHKVVNMNELPLDLIISVRLKRYWSDGRIHFFDVEMIAAIDTDITIHSPRNDSIVALKPINGAFRESWQIALDGAFQSALNGALAEFVRNFSRDPDVLKAFELAVQQKEQVKT